jgi:hypothetical protein
MKTGKGAKAEYEKRIEHLRGFKALIIRATAPTPPHAVAEGARLREQINLALPRVARYMAEVGQTPVLTQYPAPAVGGPVLRMNLLENLFLPMRNKVTRIDTVIDYTNRAIGEYADLIDSGETIEERKAEGTTGIVSALQQLLRPLFREVPADEKIVQSKVEDLLMAREIPFSREAETFQYSSKGYRPDFVLTAADTALEVKLSKPGRESDVIAEINDDILAYRTRYKSQIFVVYDVGGIRDEVRFRRDLEAHGAVVLVVKH